MNSPTGAGKMCNFSWNVSLMAFFKTAERRLKSRVLEDFWHYLTSFYSNRSTALIQRGNFLPKKGLLTNFASLLCSHFSSSTHRAAEGSSKCKCELCKHTNFDAQVSSVDWEGTNGSPDEPWHLTGAWLQWVVNNGLFTGSTKVVTLSTGGGGGGVRTVNFDVGGARTRRRCRLYSFQAENHTAKELVG